MLADSCVNDTDPLSMERFDEYDEVELEHGVVRIGHEVVDTSNGKKRKQCFVASVLNDYIESVLKAKPYMSKVENPLTREYLTSEEMDAIKNAIAKLTSVRNGGFQEVTKANDEHKEQQRNNTEMIYRGVGNFYLLGVKNLNTGNEQWYAYIPAEVESTVNSYLNSAAILQKLF
jgi:hypothetical protein